MTLIKALSLSAITLFVSGAVFAANSRSSDMAVPFDPLSLPGTSQITATYHFDSHHQVLVCESRGGDSALTKVRWSYKGVAYASSLPVQLKDDEAFNGQFADPSGKLKISNPYGGSPDQANALVACYYETLA